MQAITFLPGVTIPYAWIGTTGLPPEPSDGLDIIGNSSFTGSVVLTFESGETATVLHTSPGVSLNVLSFSTERNGSVSEGVMLNQLLPISLILYSVLQIEQCKPWGLEMHVVCKSSSPSAMHQIPPSLANCQSVTLMTCMHAGT